MLSCFCVIVDVFVWLLLFVLCWLMCIMSLDIISWYLVDLQRENVKKCEIFYL